MIFMESSGDERVEAGARVASQSPTNASSANIYCLSHCILLREPLLDFTRGSAQIADLKGMEVASY